LQNSELSFGEFGVLLRRNERSPKFSFGEFRVLQNPPLEDARNSNEIIMRILQNVSWKGEF
jgi:hypothetical protein